MALRKFLDSDGILWKVWEVIPHSVERRKLRERRIAPRDAHDRRIRHEARLRLSDGESDGWLVFESRDQKRRMRPIPRNWFTESDTVLESMCARADYARPTQRLIE
ncbi:MAG: hypothetical protein ABI969_01925 [bacterium]